MVDMVGFVVMIIEEKVRVLPGNLVYQSDMWCIHRGETLPPGAALLDCRVEPSASEYAGEGEAGVRAWASRSVISFDYRVVEVPRGRLLDPACDALVFGHLAPSSPERVAATAQAQRRLAVIDEAVHDIYGER